MVFYDNYVHLCNQIGKGVTVVAEEIGLSGNAASKWQRGANPRPTTLLKLANYFGVSVDELTKENEKTPTVSGERDDAILMFALWGSDLGDMDEDDLQAVKDYAEFLRQKKRK